MLGTMLRLVVACFIFPLLLFPIVNLVVIPLLGPVFLWCLVSAARRIWGRAPIATGLVE